MVPLALVLFMLTAVVLKLNLPNTFEGIVMLAVNVVLLLGAWWLLGREQRKQIGASKRAFTPEIPRL